jgi:hypothetical protein
MRRRRRNAGRRERVLAAVALLVGIAAVARAVVAGEASPGAGQDLPLAAPLPGAAFNDPDSVNWVDVPSEQPAGETRSSSRLLGRLAERRADLRPTTAGESARPTAASSFAGRIRGRLRGEGRIARALTPAVGEAQASEAAVSDGWPTPDRLLDELEDLAAMAGPGEAGRVASWADRTLAAVISTLDTDGPDDPRSAGLLVSMGEQVATGMVTAEAGLPPQLASETRRAALAVARRVAVWRAACDWCGVAVDEPAARPNDVGLLLGARPVADEVTRLLCFIERYETSGAADDASAVKAALAGIAESSSPRAADLRRAVSDHYLAPNVRIAVHRELVEQLLPEATVSSGGFQDFILGRPVRGRRTVEQSTGIRFVPNASEIRMELVINGQVAARTITESGPVTIHSASQGNFIVVKPVHVTPEGLAVGRSRGNASTRARLASVETSFDAVPIMGSLVRTIARNQHDDSRAEASREASSKTVGMACREVDEQAGPRLEEMAERIRERVWEPLVKLGLEPTPVALKTSEDVASLRLRLAADTQLAAHTPRPRAPGNSLLSMQLHETVANNSLNRFQLAGRRLELPELARVVCEKLGIEPRVPEDLPDGVAVTFDDDDPLRVECRDGLVHVRVALDAIESGRRNWYDLVAQVAYKPVTVGPQVFLEREGPVQIGGPGHTGRMEIGLRVIFGKIFAKERSLSIIPATIVDNPKLAGMRAVQAVATDGWLAIALAEPAPNVTGQPTRLSPTAAAPLPADRRILHR